MNKDEQTEIIECVRSWFVETVKLAGIGAGLEVYYRYNDFETSLYEQILQKYKLHYEDSRAQSLSKSEIENMPVPEYIKHVKDFLENLK